MLSTLIRLASSTAGPYVAVAVLLGLVASHGFVAWRAYSIGGSVAELQCEKRVAAIQSAYDKAKAEAEAANEKWQERIAALELEYEKSAADREREIATLNEKVKDYEASLTDRPECKLDRSDLDRLR